MTELTAALQANSAVTRWKAIAKYNQSQSPPVDAAGLALFTQALADAHPFVRWQAGQALVSAADGRQKLVAVLQTTAATLTRSAAADALRATNLPPAHALLIEALSASNDTLRQSAAEALAGQKNLAAVPHLITATKDSNPWVRRAAAYALGHLGSHDAVPTLIAALRDNVFLVRRSAAYALGALRAIEAVPQLKLALTDRDALTRRNAAWALGRVGRREAVPELTQLLNDPALNGAVATTAGWAIETITKPRWLQAILGVKGRFR